MTARRIAVAAVAALMLAACSSQDQSPEPSSTSTQAPASSTGHGAFAHCLSEHGVPAAPGPVTGPPPGVDQATWDKAMQTCGSLAPGPGPG